MSAHQAARGKSCFHRRIALEFRLCRIECSLEPRAPGFGFPVWGFKV